MRCAAHSPAAGSQDGVAAPLLRGTGVRLPPRSCPQTGRALHDGGVPREGRVLRKGGLFSQRCCHQYPVVPRLCFHPSGQRLCSPYQHYQEQGGGLTRGCSQPLTSRALGGAAGAGRTGVWEQTEVTRLGDLGQKDGGPGRAQAEGGAELRQEERAPGRGGPAPVHGPGTSDPTANPLPLPELSQLEAPVPGRLQW